MLIHIKLPIYSVAIHISYLSVDSPINTGILFYSWVFQFPNVVKTNNKYLFLPKNPQLKRFHIHRMYITDIHPNITIIWTTTKIHIPATIGGIKPQAVRIRGYYYNNEANSEDLDGRSYVLENGDLN